MGKHGEIPYREVFLMENQRKMLDFAAIHVSLPESMFLA
jgi:hypothetical protein